MSSSPKFTHIPYSRSNNPAGALPPFRQSIHIDLIGEATSRAAEERKRDDAPSRRENTNA